MLNILKTILSNYIILIIIMNIIQNIEHFSTNDILLCEPIKNTIMDNSNFIRIIISNEDIIINGIYVMFQIKSKYYYDSTTNFSSLNQHKYKKLLFVISDQDNKEIIEKLKKLERDILLKINLINKIKTFKLANNLDEGTIKVFHEKQYNNTSSPIIKPYNNSTINSTSNIILLNNNINYHANGHANGHTNNDYNHKILLKISGIWENTTSYGITYKFLLV